MSRGSGWSARVRREVADRGLLLDSGLLRTSGVPFMRDTSKHKHFHFGL